MKHVHAPPSPVLPSLFASAEDWQLLQRESAITVPNGCDVHIAYMIARNWSEATEDLAAELVNNMSAQGFVLHSEDRQSGLALYLFTKIVERAKPHAAPRDTDQSMP